MAYNPNFQWKMKTVTIAVPTSNLPAGYQVKLSIPKETEMQPDFRDIRFETTDGYGLPYWIESIASNTATVWVKLKNLVTAPTTVNIYMYYGNPYVSSVSNGTNTFEFFDDFNSSALDTSKWLEYRNNAQTTPGTYTSQSGSILIINAVPYDNSASILSIATNLPNNAIVTYRAKQAQQQYPYSILAYGNGATLLVQGYTHHGLAFTNSYLLDNTYNAFSKYNAGSYSQIDATANLTPDWGNYNVYSMILKTADTEVLRNGTSYFTGDGTNILTGTQRLSISGCYASNGGGNLYVDWVFVRKYIVTEPVTPTIGSTATPVNWNSQRKKITINATTATPANYQVKLTIPFAPEMNIDFSDLRFVSKTNVPLDYWIESSTPGVTAAIWVELADAISVSSSDYIYMHYGNQNLTSTSNARNTFVVFDDFSRFF